MAVPLDSLVKTVSAAGTAERLTTSNIYVTGATITGIPGNTGNLFAGGSDVDNTKVPIDASETVAVPAPVAHGGVVQFNLRDIWIDVGVSGEGAHVFYSQL